MARTDEQTNVRLPAELKEWLQARALKARRSLTAELTLLLENIRHQEQQTGGTST